MTPPEHFFIGASLANIIFSFQSFFKTRKFNYLVLLLLAGSASMLPDIDSFFGHYVSQNPTIGHRGMTHSIIAVIFFGFILAAITFGLTYVIMHIGKVIKNNTDASENIENYFTIQSFWILFAISTAAGVSHLIADLFQPPGVWQGIPLLFPLKSAGQYIRHGGLSITGWYDYKIMWLLIQAFLLSIPFLATAGVLNRFKPGKKLSQVFYASVIIINCTSFALLAHHIKTSQYINSHSWEKKQIKYLNQSHPLIKEITIDGKKKFLKIFVKSTR